MTLYIILGFQQLDRLETQNLLSSVTQLLLHIVLLKLNNIQKLVEIAIMWLVDTLKLMKTSCLVSGV